MSDLDINQLKLKTAEELDEAERNYLIEHQGELNEEDKAAYSEFLPRQDIEGDSPITENEPPAKEEPVEEESATPVFKSQEEVDAYLEQKLAEREEKLRTELSQPQDQEEEESGPPVFYGEGEKPRDWNEPLRKAVEVAKQEAVKEIQNMTAKEKAEAQERQKQLDEANAKIESDFKQLEKDGKIPELNSEDGKEVQKQIMQLGIKYRQPVPEAYNLWSNLSPELGGGYKGAGDPKKSKLDAQKKAAGKVGGGSKGGQKLDNSPKIKPEEWQRMDVQDLVEWGLEHS